MQPAELRALAERLAEELRDAGIPSLVTQGLSTVGGGSLPGQTLQTYVVALRPPSADRLASALRDGEPPVVARIEEGQVLLDPRTVQPDEQSALISAVGRGWELAQ